MKRHGTPPPQFQLKMGLTRVGWVDKWLEKHAPSENAVIIAEDTPDAKLMIKKAMRVLRSPFLMAQHGLGCIAPELRLPFKRIIDTVHFAAKSGAVALQLADLCAFVMGRWVKKKDIPEELFSTIIANHLVWDSEKLKSLSERLGLRSSFAEPDPSD